MKQMNRRSFIRIAGAGSAVSALAACGILPGGRAGPAHVVVVGGGPAGATTAKYLKRFDPEIQVTLVEPKATYHTCFGSNWVLGGMASMDDIAQTYGALQTRHGITVVQDKVTGIDAERRRVSLAGGGQLSYDKLVLAPGIDFRWDSVEGISEADSEAIPHAYAAGPQTTHLLRQLKAMPDGGVFAIVVPGNPFRCPPAPYERASTVAHYFKQHKPRSKILILDSKESFSKQRLFTAGWKELYGEMIEWLPASRGGRVEAIDVATRTAYSEGGQNRFAVDVLNYIPPQQAGKIAQSAGLVNETGWCAINQLTFQSHLDENIHVIGDSSVAGEMPKSAHSANSHGKLLAANIVRALAGQEMVTPAHVNSCYSLLAPDYAVSVATIYRYQEGAIVGVPGAGGLSPVDGDRNLRRMEAMYTEGWYDSITRDIWA